MPRKMREMPRARIEEVKEPGVAPTKKDFMVEKVTVPFLAIDANWRVKSKWLWDAYAGPNETYSGYITYIDELPWNSIPEEGHPDRIGFPAAPAQYYPTYAGASLGSVEDMIALLRVDGIESATIEVLCTNPYVDADFRRTLLTDLLYQRCERWRTGCGQVWSRPVTYDVRDSGNFCDNSHQAFFCRADEACDGVEGMREPGYRYAEPFFADYLLFQGDYEMRLFERYLPRGHTLDVVADLNPVLVCYILAAGSVSRIKIRDTWHWVSPATTPSYGNPYGFQYRGYRAVIRDHGIVVNRDVDVGISVELVSPRPIDLGCQVIFAFEYNYPKDIVAERALRRR